MITNNLKMYVKLLVKMCKKKRIKMIKKLEVYLGVNFLDCYKILIFILFINY